MVRGAVDFLRGYSGEQPLCLFLPLGYPHPPYCVEEPWFSRTPRNAVPPRHRFETWDVVSTTVSVAGPVAKTGPA